MRVTRSTLVAAVLILISLGIVMLASTSSVKGAVAFKDPHYFLKRQVVWLAVALCLGAGVLLTDYRQWRRYTYALAGIATALLVLVLIPGIGSRIGGSSRWLRLGPFSFQPSELAKFALVVAMASWMAGIGPKARNFKEGFLFPGMGLGVMLILVFAEPDFGTTILLGAVGMVMMFVSGTRIAYLLAAGGAGLGGIGFAVMQDPERWGRIIAFLRPEENPEGAYQLIQSKNAFVLGGLWGSGLGNSIQTHLYLPEAHTDFILAIIGEELGAVATCMVVVLFLCILVCGLLISIRAADNYGRLLGFGLTMLLTLQAVINIGVVTGCLPTKGLPLPFISYGGSSLMLAVVAVSVLLNISVQAEAEQTSAHPVDWVKDKARSF